MKRIYLLFIGLFLSFQLSAQKDVKAAQILDHILHSYEQSNGVKISFKGSADGILLIQGNRFYLESNGVKSWFNGVTQWSYVPENQEVTISNPTPEEILTINPYSLLANYKKSYHYEYIGSKRMNGEEVSEVKLTPVLQTDVKLITFSINESYHPSIILVLLADNNETRFEITSFQEQMNFSTDTFVYPEKQYPNVEIIDLR